MNKFNLAMLKSLSDNSICSIPYGIEAFCNWKNGDISFLLESHSPQFIKDILKHKKREDSSRFNSTWYFGEGYVASILGDYVEEGWFSSFKWLYDPGWVTGQNPENEKDPVIARLKRDFYENALMKYIGAEKLNDLQRIGKKSQAKAPDLWLIDRRKRHYFIEVKKGTDSPDKEHKQLMGLALIEKYLNFPTFLVYLHPENKNALSNDKQAKWLRDYNSVRI